MHKLTFTKICQELGVPSDTHKRFKRLVFLKRKFIKRIFERTGFFHKNELSVPTQRLKIKRFMSFNIFLWPSFFVLKTKARAIFWKLTSSVNSLFWYNTLFLIQLNCTSNCLYLFIGTVQKHLLVIYKIFLSMLVLMEIYFLVEWLWPEYYHIGFILTQITLLTKFWEKLDPVNLEKSHWN